MPKQTEFVYIILYIILFFVFVFALIILFVSKSRKKLFEKELEKKDLAIQFQKEILQSTILTQEQERKRIAQDLHDEISSRLNVISLNLHSLKSTKKEENQKLEIVDTTIQLNDKAIETSRKIAHNLLPPVLEKFGLHIALEELVLDFVKTKTVQINYKSTIDFTNSEPETQLQLFRIIQELINNSLKHGKASQIEILFENINQKNQCIYKDDGQGFDTSKLDKSKGLGMRNIESRIEYLHGKYHIESEPEKGIIFTYDFNL
jgi:two-component system, NarL family, sensor kinase